jgi:hypothetical protein
MKPFISNPSVLLPAFPLNEHLVILDSSSQIPDLSTSIDSGQTKWRTNDSTVPPHLFVSLVQNLIIAVELSLIPFLLLLAAIIRLSPAYRHFFQHLHPLLPHQR